MIGPGRMGIHHLEPGASEVDSILSDLASVAGKPADYVKKLLKIFASVEVGGICGKEARCDSCVVNFCKRLRYR